MMKKINAGFFYRSEMKRADSDLWVLLIGVSLFFSQNVVADTNSADVSALNVMYNSLNSAPQLTGWKSSGGDPCGDHWKGITCSDSSVKQIKLSGLGLTGTMGYQLSSLTDVTYFDLSHNNLRGDIPYQLPPNAEHINLAGNSFSGNVPYSMSQMTDLKYLNLGHNQLNGQLNDMFSQLEKLTTLDLSYNSFSGNLPQSLGSLSKLKTLLLQNNQFTGSLAVLSKLSLDNLDVENNRLNGPIPKNLANIKSIKTGGNAWSSQPASSDDSSSNDEKKDTRTSSSDSSSIDDLMKEMGPRVVIIAGGVVLGLLIFGILLAIFSQRQPRYLDEEKMSNSRPSFSPLVSHELKELRTDSTSSVNMKILLPSPSVGLKPPPSDRLKSFNDTDYISKMGSKRSRGPLTATCHSLAELQMAAGSFDKNHLLGEGSLGCVFKAKYVDGKIFAVKKLEVGNFRGDNSDEFQDMVADVSRLRHPNISELIGYCSERGQNLLVYEYLRNGSLHEFLHLSDDYSKPLTWNTRIRISLGTARALEYLHETCSPAVIHKNIKSANILLDMDLNPHLSDCGFATFYQDLNRNLGIGYCAPEYTTSGTYGPKSDVYSFGVVMLELLTGRMPFDSLKPKTEQSLVRWASPQLHDIDSLTKMVDPALRGLYPAKSLSRYADVIALCVQPEPEFRPPMSEVVQALVRLVQRTSINKRSGDEPESRRMSDADSSEFY